METKKEEKKIDTTPYEREQLYREDISISPAHLNRGLKDYLRELLLLKYNHTCLQEYGYITDIDEKSMKIVSNRISRADAGVIYVTVECKMKCLKPVVGSVYPAIVTSVFEYGVVVNVLDTFEGITTTPVTMREEWMYQDVEEDTEEEDTDDGGGGGGVYIQKSTGREIGVNSVIDIEIRDVTFTNGNFQCSGKLV